MIEAHALSKTYGAKTAVDDVTFTVQPGTATGFLGRREVHHDADDRRPRTAHGRSGDGERQALRAAPRLCGEATAAEVSTLTYRGSPGNVSEDATDVSTITSD